MFVIIRPVTIPTTFDSRAIGALYVALPPHRRLPIGWHGAVLPLLLIPLGVALARALDVPFVTPWRAAAVTPPVVVAYYVLWKYVVHFLNRLLEIQPGAAVATGERA